MIPQDQNQQSHQRNQSNADGMNALPRVLTGSEENAILTKNHTAMQSIQDQESISRNEQTKTLQPNTQNATDVDQSSNVNKNEFSQPRLPQTSSHDTQKQPRTSSFEFKAVRSDDVNNDIREKKNHFSNLSSKNYRQALRLLNEEGTTVDLNQLEDILQINYSFDTLRHVLETLIKSQKNHNQLMTVLMNMIPDQEMAVSQMKDTKIFMQQQEFQMQGMSMELFNCKKSIKDLDDFQEASTSVSVETTRKVQQALNEMRALHARVDEVTQRDEQRAKQFGNQIAEQKDFNDQVIIDLKRIDTLKSDIEEITGKLSEQKLDLEEQLTKIQAKSEKSIKQVELNQKMLKNLQEDFSNQSFRFGQDFQQLNIRSNEQKDIVESKVDRKRFDAEFKKIKSLVNGLREQTHSIVQTSVLQSARNQQKAETLNKSLSEHSQHNLSNTSNLNVSGGFQRQQTMAVKNKPQAGPFQQSRNSQPQPSRSSNSNQQQQDPLAHNGHGRILEESLADQEIEENDVQNNRTKNQQAKQQSQLNEIQKKAQSQAKNFRVTPQQLVNNNQRMSKIGGTEDRSNVKEGAVMSSMYQEANIQEIEQNLQQAKPNDQTEEVNQYIRKESNIQQIMEHLSPMLDNPQMQPQGKNSKMAQGVRPFNAINNTGKQNKVPQSENQTDFSATNNQPMAGITTNDIQQVDSKINFDNMQTQNIPTQQNQVTFGNLDPNNLPSSIKQSQQSRRTHHLQSNEALQQANHELLQQDGVQEIIGDQQQQVVNQDPNNSSKEQNHQHQQITGIGGGVDTDEDRIKVVLEMMQESFQKLELQITERHIAASKKQQIKEMQIKKLHHEVEILAAEALQVPIMNKTINQLTERVNFLIFENYKNDNSNQAQQYIDSQTKYIENVKDKFMDDVKEIRIEKSQILKEFERLVSLQVEDLLKELAEMQKKQLENEVRVRNMQRDILETKEYAANKRSIQSKSSPNNPDSVGKQDGQVQNDNTQGLVNTSAQNDVSTKHAEELAENLQKNVKTLADHEEKLQQEIIANKESFNFSLDSLNHRLNAKRRDENDIKLKIRSMQIEIDRITEAMSITPNLKETNPLVDSVDINKNGTQGERRVGLYAQSNVLAIQDQRLHDLEETTNKIKTQMESGKAVQINYSDGVREKDFLKLKREVGRINEVLESFKKNVDNMKEELSDQMEIRASRNDLINMENNLTSLIMKHYYQQKQSSEILGQLKLNVANLEKQTRNFKTQISKLQRAQTNSPSSPNLRDKLGILGNNLDHAILSKNNNGQYACASCDREFSPTYLFKKQKKYQYNNPSLQNPHSWRQMPQRDPNERINRVGQGFKDSNQKHKDVNYSKLLQQQLSALEKLTVDNLNPNIAASNFQIDLQQQEHQSNSQLGEVHQKMDPTLIDTREHLQNLKNASNEGLAQPVPNVSNIMGKNELKKYYQQGTSTQTLQKQSLWNNVQGSYQQSVGSNGSIQAKKRDFNETGVQQTFAQNSATGSVQGLTMSKSVAKIATLQNIKDSLDNNIEVKVDKPQGTLDQFIGQSQVPIDIQKKLLKKQGYNNFQKNAVNKDEVKKSLKKTLAANTGQGSSNQVITSPYDILDIKQKQFKPVMQSSSNKKSSTNKIAGAGGQLATGGNDNGKFSSTLKNNDNNLVQEMLQQNQLQQQKDKQQQSQRASSNNTSTRQVINLKRKNSNPNLKVIQASYTNLQDSGKFPQIHQHNQTTHSATEDSKDLYMIASKTAR